MKKNKKDRCKAEKRRNSRWDEKLIRHSFLLTPYTSIYCEALCYASNLVHPIHSLPNPTVVYLLQSLPSQSKTSWRNWSVRLAVESFPEAQSSMVWPSNRYVDNVTTSGVWLRNLDRQVWKELSSRELLLRSRRVGKALVVWIRTDISSYLLYALLDDIVFPLSGLLWVLTWHAASSETHLSIREPLSHFLLSWPSLAWFCFFTILWTLVGSE